MVDFLTIEELQYNDENALSYTISLALYAARNFYTVYRELPGGKGLVEGIRHGIIVSNLARLLAMKLNMEDIYCYEMAKAGLLHDIGKLRLSKYLYGRGKNVLQIEEMKYVRKHSEFSYDILSKYEFSPLILESIYHHHENFDGSGYPDNLKGYDIPKGARIL